jgi:hypothetical protein
LSTYKWVGGTGLNFASKLQNWVVDGVWTAPPQLPANGTFIPVYHWAGMAFYVYFQGNYYY